MYTAEMECTICMETMGEQTILPCQCKLHYCQACWDKALASSFSQCGQARCPSCRAFVRVDFDAERRCLVFAPETVDMTTSSQQQLAKLIQSEYLESVKVSQSQPSRESMQRFILEHDRYKELAQVDEMRTATIRRLRLQAMPAQIMLLQQYGEANPSLLQMRSNASEALATSSIPNLVKFMNDARVDTAGCIEKSEMISRLLIERDNYSICGLWASQTGPEPQCVCRSTLQRIGGEERFRRCLGDKGDELSDEVVQQRLLHLQEKDVSLVICDCCEQSVPLSRTSSVWTCVNRNCTILHATSYDICDKCFVRHACKEAEES